MDLVSIIFHAKHFEQKYALTGLIHVPWRLDPLSAKISFEKSNFLIFCAFLRILHVYDFFFINVLFNWAVRKSIYKIFGFNAITKIQIWFFLPSFNFNFDICTCVGSWLDKITFKFQNTSCYILKKQPVHRKSEILLYGMRIFLQTSTEVILSDKEDLKTLFARFICMMCVYIYIFHYKETLIVT